MRSVTGTPKHTIFTTMPLWSLTKPDKSPQHVLQGLREWRSGFLWVRSWWISVSNRVCHIWILDCTIHSTIRFHLHANVCKQHFECNLQLTFPPYFGWLKHIPRCFVKSSLALFLQLEDSFTSAVIICGLLGLASCTLVSSFFHCREESDFPFVGALIWQWIADAVGKVLN